MRALPHVDAKRGRHLVVGVGIATAARCKKAHEWPGSERGERSHARGAERNGNFAVRRHGERRRSAAAATSSAAARSKVGCARE